MRSLLIDTHDKSVLLAIYENDILIEKIEKNEQKDHSTICIPTLIQILSQAKIDIKEIDDIIVVIGPGSFTGVRIGVTIAKTLAYSLNIPIRTITSLELYLPIEKEYEYLSIVEKNGYFIGNINNNGLINEYEYLKTNEYEQFLKNHKIKNAEEINIDSIAKYAHQKSAVNPHLVNPFYVKKIEVEK